MKLKFIFCIFLSIFLLSCEKDEPQQNVSEYELTISAGEINYSGFSVDININAEILKGNDLYGDYMILYGSSESDLSKSIVIETDTSFENYSDKSYNFAELTYGKTYIQVIFNSEILNIKSNIIVVDTNDLSADGFVNGYAYVDLGLPSGLKWATCNVGASSPTEYGDYFAWGEVFPKTSYNSKNSLTYENSDFYKGINISGNPNYDAATANWGGSWRMPTKDEFEELEYNCKWERFSNYDVVSNQKTGKFIILPFAGYMSWTSLSFFKGYPSGYYWMSTTSNIWYTEDADCYVLLTAPNYDSRNSSYENRYYGCSIRPVSD